DVDARRDVEDDGVRVAQGENHLLALELRAVADADDVELFLEAFGDALHRVRDEAARQPVVLRQVRVGGRPLRLKRAVRELEVDAGRKRLPHLALRALHLDRAVGDLDGDALRDRDRFFAYT